MALAGRDVGAVLAWRCEDGQRDGLDDRYEERSGGMRKLPDVGHRLEDAERVGLADQHGRDRGPVAERALQGGQVGRTVVERGQLLEAEAGRAEVSAGGVKVMAMDGPTGQDALTTRGPDGHQRRFRGRSRAVVVRGRNDIEAGQLGDERLILIDRLQRALADLRLIGRVGGVELAARDDLVDRRRQEVAIHARPQEARQVDSIAGRQALEARGKLELRLGPWQVEAMGADRGRDIGEEGVDALDAQCAQHPRPIVGRVGTVGHRLSRPWSARDRRRHPSALPRLRRPGDAT
jgi:hypothetical protein